jgi:hypothetical protein
MERRDILLLLDNGETRMPCQMEMDLLYELGLIGYGYEDRSFSH